MSSIRAFIGRGALAGLFGGFAAAIFQWLVTERQIRLALALEHTDPAHAAADELFSRGTQVVGGMLATCLYGLFLGVVFGVVCAALWHTLPGGGAFGRSLRLAVASFVAWTLVPALKYPANPPGVGDPDTIGDRTVSYVSLLVASIVVTYLMWELWQRLSSRGVLGAPRFALVGGVYVAVVGAMYVLLPPSPDAVDAPANLIWHFRLDVLAGGALVWLVMGTVFGWLGERAEAVTSRPARRHAVDA